MIIFDLFFLAAILVLPFCALAAMIERAGA